MPKDIRILRLITERTPNSGNANNVRNVNTDGTLNNNNANNANGVVPDCENYARNKVSRDTTEINATFTRSYRPILDERENL